MKTKHRIHIGNAIQMDFLEENSIDLVVTSPPYPMIEMWDEPFCSLDPSIRQSLKNNEGPEAFDLMHAFLDKVWRQLYRVMRPGGILCINIGDATRTLADHFRLYPNHSRITYSLQELGFTILPNIIWRKQTNAPNKFMGSGMMPPGAYVTLEHEYIIIARKGGKRIFKTGPEKEQRRSSAYFWEERNTWFSDVWFDLKGIQQKMIANPLRNRSGAFPFELAYRLINMHSVKEDVVLDPFLGTGTTCAAAIAAARNSVGVEIEAGLFPIIDEMISRMADFTNTYLRNRLKNHWDFVQKQQSQKKTFKYVNAHHQFPVVTMQEKNMVLNELQGIVKIDKQCYEAIYTDTPIQPVLEKQMHLFSPDMG